MTTPPIPPELAELRRSIDNLDAALVHTLAERFRCTKAVGELKARLELPAADPAREKRQVARLRELATESGLDADFAEKFLTLVIEEVIHHHERISGQAGQAGQAGRQGQTEGRAPAPR